MNMAGIHTEDDACPASLCSFEITGNPYEINLVEDPAPENDRTSRPETREPIHSFEQLTLVPRASSENIQGAYGHSETQAKIPYQPPTPVASASENIQEQKKEEYFDIAMIYDDDDLRRVEILADILKKFIVFNGGQSLSICVDDSDLENGLGELRLLNYEHMLKNSYCYFVFLSEKSRGTNFDLTKFKNYCALCHYLKNAEKHKLVPVVTSKEVDLEKSISFGSFQPVDISQLLKHHQSLDDMVVSELTDDNMNMKIVNNIAEMLKKGREKNSLKDIGNTVCNNSSEKCSNNNLQPTTQSMPHIGIIQQNSSYLVECLCTEYGLLTCLYSSGYISRREMEEIEVEKTSYDKNEKLLKLIQDKDSSVFEYFLHALKETNQGFIAEKLTKPI